jgi:uncharacterized membrane protein
MRVIDVSATSSVNWIAEAFVMFRAQPLAWISLTSGWLLASLLMFLVPVVGAPLMSIAQPGFFAGFVLACRDQEMGRPVTTSHLLAGFRLNGKPLIQIGSVSLLAESAVAFVIGLLGFFDALKGIDQNSSIEALSAAISSVGGLWIAALAAMFLIKGVLWFTAALMAHEPMSASHAIRWSFFALVANFIPLAGFGVLMMGLFFAALVPWGLGLLVFMPVYAICHYTSFKSVFRADAE